MPIENHSTLQCKLNHYRLSMDRIRQHLTRRRRSSGSSNTPLQSRSLSASGEKRKKDRDSIPRRLVLTSDTPEFDQRIIRRFEAEGLRVKYLPFLGGGQDLDRDRRDLENRLNELEDDLEPGERYAVVGKSIVLFALCSEKEKERG